MPLAVFPGAAARILPAAPPVHRPARATAKIRERIDQGGDEHVAGDAADRIEVDMLACRVTRPAWTGTT